MKYLYFLLLFFLAISCKNESEQVHNKFSGNIFGTYYNVQFYDTNVVDYTKEIDSIFSVLNNSMSTYQSNSLISSINNGSNNTNVDSHFVNVFKSAKTVFKETDGFFDPTIGGVVNAWNFGPKKEVVKVDSVLINNLMNFVGFENVKITNDDIIIKKYSETYLDFNAIAKGYALDVLASFLSNKDHDNFLIDIGGEVLAKGTKPNANLWNIGIDRPNFEGYQESQKIISISDMAMATSGVYRKFKVDKLGNRYAHIIDAKTGYPSKTNILSVSVIANSCMIADAYATAFQAMGIERTKKVIEINNTLKVYFIYENNGIVKTLALNGFPN